MAKKPGTAKKLSNPFSTGGGGPHFEAHIQACFVSLMLTGGYAPCVPSWPIQQVKLQGKVDGYDTDDAIVYVTKPGEQDSRKLILQIKHTIGIAQGDTVFAEVMQAAWNDFKNPKLFDAKKDVLALVTGPLSATDYRNVSWLLNQARHTKTVQEFLRNVVTANFSPAKAEEKLNVFRHHLQAANGGVRLTDQELYEFLNRYHLLGYDLGSEVGVVLSLLHSHISQFHKDYPQWAWSRIVDIVQTWNQDAGTVSLDKLPEDLKDAFQRAPVARMPASLAVVAAPGTPTDWAASDYAEELALVSLIGGWDESKPADIEVIEALSGRPYADWIKGIRGVLQLRGSPLRLKSGVWQVIDRPAIWEALGPRVFDQLLDAFGTQAAKLFSQIDPIFDLPVEERSTAAFSGKVLPNSGTLRSGLADGLALLGSRAVCLTNCSVGKANAVAVLSVRQVLKDAAAKVWGSVQDVLPDLAEAAPDEFLRWTEEAAQANPSPFDELFGQEGNGIDGTNYMVGLLWALEALAWEEQFLVRACAVLGDLASHDPGGTWSNRPSNSLTTILLPWLPQTRASIEKRKVAVEVVCTEQPDVGWALLLSLLPDQQRTTSGTYRPKWRNPVADMNDAKPTLGQYREQVLAYSGMAVTLADSVPKRLGDLVKRFAELPAPIGATLVQALSSEPVLQLPEDQKADLWGRLSDLVLHHQKYGGAEWAMHADQIAHLAQVREKLKPSDVNFMHERLFSNDDFNLYQGTDNWDQERDDLQRRRNEAVAEILASKGLEGVLSLAEAAEAPRKVGDALGFVGDGTIDGKLLPAYLRTTSRNASQFLEGFIWVRRAQHGWEWVDSLDMSTWSGDEIGRLLSSLPFTQETWKRVEDRLGPQRSEYWTKVFANPYHAGKQDTDLRGAVERLLEHDRPRAAVECLYKMAHDHEAFPPELAVRALMGAVSSKETALPMQHHYVVDVIKHLQKDEKTDANQLRDVEWAYLSLLGRREETRPIELERRISSDPAFYVQLIRAIYRSERERDKPKREPNESERAIASNAWRLLHEWKRLPGVDEQECLDAVAFKDWIQEMKQLAKESGHLSVAMIQFGEVLIHAPADPGGLWIDRTVAEVLNGKDAEKMRQGFSTGIFNSRGAHWVDPTGEQERKLADGHRIKGEAVEKVGFHRLAVTLRQLAESYEREAERVASEESGDT